MRASWWAAVGCGALIACNDGVITPGTDSQGADTALADSAAGDGASADSGASDTGAATETSVSDTVVARETNVSDSAIDSAIDSNAAETTTPDAGDTHTTTDAGDAGDTTVTPACGAAPAWIGDVQVARNGRYATVSGLPAGDVPTRVLTVYLPANYDSDSAQHFPVMYMHDGQNLFDDASAAYDEWGVDEAVDAATASDEIAPLIVVGIPNNADRIAEYTPTADLSEGGGHGAAYVRWLIDVVKPAIDASFRTECARESTAVVGSSLGGLISLWMATDPEASQVFGRVGVVSPTLWWDGDAVLAAIEASPLPSRPTRLWVDMGTNEPELGRSADDIVARARRLRDRLLALGMQLGVDFGYLEDVGATHDEHAWRARLPAILRSLWGAPMTGRPTGLGIHPWADGIYLDARPTIGVSVEADYDPSGRLTIVGSSAQLATTDVGVTTMDGARIRGLAAGPGTLSASYLGAAALGSVTVFDTGLVPLRFIVHVPAFTDRVYVAGDPLALGPWDPGLVHLGIVPPLGSDLWTVEVPVGAGVPVHYKYTRGDWASVEVHPDGTDIGDRIVGPFSDEAIVHDDVPRWHDF